MISNERVATLEKYLDRFLGPEYKKDAEIYYKSRILVAIVLVYELLLVFTDLYVIFLAPIPTSSAWWTVLLVTTMIAGYGYVLHVLRNRFDYDFCIEASVFSAYAGITAGICMSGGPLVSPATPLMILPIVLAFCLSTRYSGLRWSNIVLLTHVALVVIDTWVYKFPQFMNMKFALVHHLVHWLIAYLAIIALMMIFENITRRLKEERDAERDRFRYLAAHDPLTGLSNRAMFEEELETAIARCRRQNQKLALMYIDLDGFKPINDRLGHDAGDLVLCEVARRLTQVLRRSDAIARLGGDEFAVIAEGIVRIEDAEYISRKVIEEINKPYPGLREQMPVGASVGISVYPRDSERPEELRKLSDTAMYRAKVQKNTFVFFSMDFD